MAGSRGADKAVNWWLFVLRLACYMIQFINYKKLRHSDLHPPAAGGGNVVSATAFPPYPSDQDLPDLMHIVYARRMIRCVYRRTARLPDIQRIAGKFLYGEYTALAARIGSDTES